MSARLGKNLHEIRDLLAHYKKPQDGQTFFRALGYPVIEPLSMSLKEMPPSVQETVRSFWMLVRIGDPVPFQIFHVELSSLRRTDIRRFLETYYRHFPQGENLFVFSSPRQPDELAFVSPRRLPDHRDPRKVRLWLRTLQVRRSQPYRTDLEILDHLRLEGRPDPEEVWKIHEEAFRVERVSECFFEDYRVAFTLIRDYLRKTHPDASPEWYRNYTHHLLNRIMFLYYVIRKGWMLGPTGEPDRDFMRHLWEAYRASGSPHTFHQEWLDVLFFEAFNNRWQNRAEYLKRFPSWLVHAFSQAPYLNGGLYTRRPGLDDQLKHPLPDEFFELLFERWTDGTFPGLFERYNFTVVESGRFDQEVAVDPEMLGKVYERLVNVTFESGDEDLRGDAGVFYTPRTEIDLMGRLALVDWLSRHLGDGHRDLLYEWVFAFSEEEKRDVDGKITEKGLWKDLNRLVGNVRICDPACGSGSFLVGMLLILDDLKRRCDEALGESQTPYERRKRIIRDQLYGVDIMEWAVRVAELRLWLQLVVETDVHPAERHFRPLLPNLNLKLRPGDSLLQTLGDLDLSPFRRGELAIPHHLKGRLVQLIGKKRRFFQGEEPGLTESLIQKEEIDLFREILDHRIHELNNALKKTKNKLDELERVRSRSGEGELFPGSGAWKRMEANIQEGKQKLESEIRELEARLERYRKAKEALRSASHPPFVWDMAFVEVFEDENPGFDIVIGNPPYVRQEKIRDYLNRFDRKEYLGRLNGSLRAIYPRWMGSNRTISGRADYYVYFYLHALSLLAEKGSFCFITSNSWLDVDFGKDLQEFFLRAGDLKMVVDNRARRSFAEADVNTVIVLAGAPVRDRLLSEDEMKCRQVRFVAFRVPFEEAMNPVIFSEIEDDGLYEARSGFRVLARPEFRSVLLDFASLYREGLEEGGRIRGTGRYGGNKWGGKYLRAPDIFFTILEKGKGKLVRLGDIAEVRFGIKTGANEFFYLEPVGRTVKEVAELRERNPMAPVRVKNGVGWEGEIEAAFLVPLLFSLKEAPSVRVELERLRRCVFVCRLDLNQLRVQGYKHAMAYIQAFAQHKVQLKHGGECLLPHVPSLRGRNPWYALPEQRVPAFISNRFLGERFVFLEGGNALVCDVFFVGYLNDPKDRTVMAALLNSSLTAMVADILARKTYGVGVAYLYGPEVNSLTVVRPSAIIAERRQRLLSAFMQLADRPVRSVFQELGFPLCRERRCDHPEHPYEHVRPEALTLEQVRQASPDRFELDRVVFDVLGLTDEERLEVYRAVAQLVKDRLLKAKSV